MAISERRRSPRKQIIGAIAVIRFPGLPEMVARMGDVSPLGFCFFQADCEKSLSGSADMDILFLQENIFWQHMPCAVVSDTFCVEVRPAVEQSKRRYSVKFKMLTAKQESWLKNFIGIAPEHNQRGRLSHSAVSL